MNNEIKTPEEIGDDLIEIPINKIYNLKVGYYKDNKDIERLAQIANEYADDISGINTLQAEILEMSQLQALCSLRLFGTVLGQLSKYQKLMD